MGAIIDLLFRNNWEGKSAKNAISTLLSFYHFP